MSQLPSHKAFFIEEYFGSRMYNSQGQAEYYFDPEMTVAIKKLIADEGGHDAVCESARESLVAKGLLTSDMMIIDNGRCDGISAPLKISLNITKKCNLNCKHCLSDSGVGDSNELTTNDYFKLIDSMRSAGTFFITIGGGEPLLREDIFDIIRYARDNYIAVSLVTNGQIMTDELAEKLNGFNLDTITLSLDGLEDNHDYIRGEGSFRKTIKSIKILRRHITAAKLAVRVTVNNRNAGECEELIRLAEELSIDTIRLTPMLLLGRAKENTDLLLSQEEYIKFLQEAICVQSSIKVVLPHQENKSKFFVTPDDFGCHCGKEACWISHTGEYSPCIFFGGEFMAGNIKDEDYLSLWTKSKAMVELCGNGLCRSCPDYRKCRGGCRARALWEYKDINAVDPLCPLKRNKIKLS